MSKTSKTKFNLIAKTIPGLNQILKTELAK